LAEQLPALELTEVRKRTVQERADGTHTILFQVAVAADEAPAWWSRQRDTYLDKFWPTEPYLAGAVFSVAARNAAFRYELEGPRTQVEWAQQLLAQADLGNGWQSFITKLSLDLLTQDNGAFIEVIRPAKVKVKRRWHVALKKRNTRGELAWYAVKDNEPVPLRGRYKIVDSPLDLPIGLAHLDSQRCSRTGDLEYPVVYKDLKGGQHKLSWWQVITLEELPSAREDMKGIQRCAVSRVLKAAQILRDIAIYKHEKVSGRFARAVHLTNVQASAVQDAITQAEANADNMGLMRYIQPIVVDILDPTATPAVETIELASLPDSFDEEVTLRWYIACLAMGFGVDYGFLAPLPGKGLGTAAQSETQERQARGKSSRTFMETMSYKLNYHGILPASVVFRFSVADPYVESERDRGYARRVRARSTGIQSGELTPEIARQLASDIGDLPPKYLELMGEADATPIVVGAGHENPDFSLHERTRKMKKVEVKAEVKDEEEEEEEELFVVALAVYVGRLLVVYRAWSRKWARRLARKGRGDVPSAVRDMEDELDEVALAFLAGAFLVGAETDTLSEAGREAVDVMLVFNRKYLTEGLGPDVVAWLGQVEEWTEAQIGEALGMFEGRVSLYGQPFWQLIWEGMEEKVKRLEAQGLRVGVRRVLDSLATHCATCPPKAWEYRSWEAMIETCGGVPGSLASGDECGPNCKCWWEIVT